MKQDERERLAALRVLWVSHSYGYGGDLMYYGEIFRQFRELVPQTTVAVDSSGTFHNPHGIDLRPLMRLWRWKTARTTSEGQVYDTEIAYPSPTLLPRLMRSQADIIITIEFTPPALIAALAATLSPRKRLVLLVESDPAARAGNTSRTARALKRWAVRRADAIQTNNVKGRRYLVEDLGADPAKVRVAPYLTSRPPGAEARRDESDGPVQILFANSLVARKGLNELLAALALVEPPLREQIVLTVVGDGPGKAAAAELATALGMDKNVRFAGWQAYGALGGFYAEADVLAIPSLADYRSLAGFEGLAYGLALLSSRYDGATEETVQEGVNGFAIDPRDPAMVAERIARIVRDRGLMRRMQRESKSLYNRKFSLEAIAENLGQTVLAAEAG